MRVVAVTLDGFAHEDVIGQVARFVQEVRFSKERHHFQRMDARMTSNLAVTALAAGVAMRGTFAHDWRTDEAFLAARRAPPGGPARVGRWAEFGVARGYMQGREGCSYAVQTVVRGVSGAVYPCGKFVCSWSTLAASRGGIRSSPSL